MSEKLDFGESRTRSVIRTPALKFVVTRWDWSKGAGNQAGNPIDITHAVMSFRWMKSTRNPDSGCELQIIPQQGDLHYMDIFSTMDVVQIFEFGTLKYQGFIRRIAARGSISQAGTPSRTVAITCSSFGALLTEGQLGFNVFLKAGTFNDIDAKIKAFSGKLSDIITGGGAYSEMIGAVVDEWFGFLDQNGASNFRSYFQRWIDYKSGLGGKLVPGAPKDLKLFYTTEQQVTLWSVIQKIIQAPFNEFWFDCGPRKLWVENSESLSPAKPGEITLGNEIDYMVIRCPPFNGTVVDGATSDLWDSLPSRMVPLTYLTQFDLNKSMDESLSFYLVSPAIYSPGEIGLIASGKYAIDEDAFNKYLYRPAIHDLYYTRIQKPQDKAVDDKASDIYSDAQDKADTLLNWNKNNDEFLSGAFTFMVPSNEEHDPRIGDKIELEGISEAFFYVEGVSHSWNYGGPLVSNVSVTRGWGNGRPIELKDRIFKRGKFITGEKFK
jgi:hypothetical protein